MLNLFAKYLREREGFDLLEGDHSFLTFKIQDNGTIYIRDLFTDPDYRNSGEASALADRACGIAKAAGCMALIGSVDVRDPNADYSIHCLHSTYKMRFMGLEGSLLIFRKEL